MRALSSPKWVVATVNRECWARYFNRAIANALPSEGSVPAPTSSNKTKDLGIGNWELVIGIWGWGICNLGLRIGRAETVFCVSVTSSSCCWELVIVRFEFSAPSACDLFCKTSKMRLMRRIWPEKVDKLCCKDCSSPISAKILSNQGNSTGSRAATNIPAFAIKAANPKVLRVTVLPPVLGPVMATTRMCGPIVKSTGTTGKPCSCCCCQTNKGWRNWRRVICDRRLRINN